MLESAPIVSSNIADLFTRPLPATTHHRYSRIVIGDVVIGDIPTASSTSVATVNTAPTAPVVASASTPATTSDSVPTLIHPNPVPYLIDTGASFPIAPTSPSEFAPAPFGLIRSALSVVSNTKIASKAYSTPVDPYTLITGEDTATASSVDPSSPDLFALDSDSVESFDIWEFGTATLVFISNPKLTTILVEPTVDWTDWFDWIPLPRLTPTESYYHIFGLDCSQAFALFHLIPIWIYCLLHFGLE